eukprot:1921852-Pyramimonas_sp.AAC.1
MRAGMSNLIEALGDLLGHGVVRGDHGSLVRYGEVGFVLHLVPYEKASLDQSVGNMTGCAFDSDDCVVYEGPDHDSALVAK